MVQQNIKRRGITLLVITIIKTVYLDAHIFELLLNVVDLHYTLPKTI